MSNETIKQHYVPQFYLKNFSNIKNNNYILNCYDIVKNEMYPVNINNVAQEKYFYKINNQSFEGNFQKVENPASRIINNLTNYKNYKLLNNNKNRFFMSLFMSSQYLRTKEMRETVNELNFHLEEYLKNYKLKAELNKYLDYLNNTEIKIRHKDVFENSLNKISFLLFMKKWIILTNKSDRNFYTSDNPIVRYNPQGKIGFACDYLQVYYPINPRTLICLLDPFNYGKVSNNFKIQMNNDKQNPYKNFTSNIYKINTCKITDRNKVDFFNNFQFNNATRHVFSKDENFIKNINYMKNNKQRNRVALEKINVNSKDIIHIHSPN